MIELPIVHWNDVYRVRPQKISPTSSETIDVTQFAALVDDIRDQWPQRPDGKRDGLSLFSGDVFSPSIESSVTRGSHMVPVMNELAPDVSLLGNHDFDFGYPHLCNLIQDTNFPWLLSNIIDKTTSQVPEHMYPFQTLERRGVRIGVIGLVEKEWIGTVASWPSDFVCRDMAETGKELSRLLRDPSGPHKCDIVIALTHARVPNVRDVQLAKDLFCLTPSGQRSQDITNQHGVDIILGGHDHLYFVGRGVDAWENCDLTHHVLGGEKDYGDVLVVKSGTDFRDLSEIVLELENTPEGSVRRKVVSKVKGIRHEVTPDMRSCNRLKAVLDNILKSVGASLKARLCKLSTELDLRSHIIRTEEAGTYRFLLITASADWFADILRHTYDDALCMKGYDGGADGVFICAGMLRGDSVYGPGYLTLGDVMEILPFEDPLVVLEIDGKTLWDTLEASLTTWPAQEGRFPVISGFRVSWDSRLPPGQRVIGVWLHEDPDDGMETPLDSGHTTPTRTGGEPILRKAGGRKYKIVTREYMAQGHDGFLPLKGQRYLIDDESGQITSTVVRKYLLGARFIARLASNNESQEHLHPDTHQIIAHERSRRDRLESNRTSMSEKWHHAAVLAVQWARSRKHYRDHIAVTSKEHMSFVDCFDGAKQRAGMPQNETDADNSEDGEGVPADEDLFTVHLMLDDRLKDQART
ncbi:Metallo-dependent phosphatase [Artomyces pyxidatus]|uniref:Metallo-dependent phosphatase n=1 Tax=Artomyces pyxidatus TaxID=48021 RepID=A0ACB8SG62_9AGAM|nr:Metallo-dependent phosphatase [Artomyces pyxidatus]